MANPQYGAYQQYALAAAANTSKLPESVSLEAGATTILNLAAVSSAITIFGGLGKPSLSSSSANDAPKNGKKILIYGGSSSTGGLAIRYALAAGYDVVTTSSPANREYVQSLSPRIILNHSAPTEALSSEIRQHGPYDFILDTIGTPPVTDLLVAYVDSLGGGSYNTMIPPLGGEAPIPERVQRKFEPYNFAFEKPQHRALKTWFFEEMVPKGLETGVVVPTRPQWVAGGLEKVQEALDLMAEDKVSGRKLVLDPWA